MKDWEVVAGNDAQQCEEQVRQVYHALPVLEIPLVLVRFNHIANRIINADRSIM